MSHFLQRIEARRVSDAVLKWEDVLIVFTDYDTVQIDEDPRLCDMHPQAFIVASRHKSESGLPCLTVHTPGNLTDQTYGGKPRKVCLAWPCMIKALLKAVVEEASTALREYRVSLEATHHGPTELSSPVVFIEIGSTERQWVDGNAGAVWARVLEKVLERGPPACVPAVGLGGTHYAPKFTNLTLSTNLGFGHIIPRTVCERLDFEILYQAVERTLGNGVRLVIDKKGVRGVIRRRLIAWAEQQGMTVEVK